MALPFLKRLCCLSSVLRACCCSPGSLSSSDRVEDDEELSHTSGDDDLEWLTRLLKALGEFSDARIESPRGSGGHEEDGSHGGPTSPGHAFASEQSAVSIERCDTDECCDLFPIELSQFGKFGQESSGRRGTDTWYGLKQSGLSTPIIIRLDHLSDLNGDPLDLVGQRLRDVMNALPCDGVLGLLLTVFFHGEEFDELTPPSDEGVQFPLFFRGWRSRSRPNLLGEQSQDSGIDPVGLGEFSEALGEVSGLTGIDDSDVVALLEKLSSHGTFDTAGGLKDDKTSPAGREHRRELLMPVGRIGESLTFRLRCDPNVEVLFGNVDPHELGDRIR